MSLQQHQKFNREEYKCLLKIYQQASIYYELRFGIITMTVITLRLPDKLLHQVDQQTKNLHISRAEYIRTAINHNAD